MHYRVHEILLVSSPYDAFILEEDGRLTPRLFVEYSNLSLSLPPRITRARTAGQAVELLLGRRFDLVITMVQLQDMDVTSFARRVKGIAPGTPMVLLAFSEAELIQNQALTSSSAIDRVFLWTGDTGILIAAIKLVEDQFNVDHDIKTADLRCLIVVEDSVRRYSSFLSMLYSELVTQSASLIAEGVNDLHKVLRLRARPKILLATTYEEAIAYYERYRENVLAIITDKRFPRDGELNADAGLDLIRVVQKDVPNLPILLQSADHDFMKEAEALNVAYAKKNSPSLLKKLRRFLSEDLGFGSFIFRHPEHSEVGRASNTYEMEQLLHTVPGVSLAFHSAGGHFSLWLMARGMFRLAAQVRAYTIDESGSVEALRQDLIEVLRQARLQDQEGAITDFTSRQLDADSRFVRLGGGSLGGKGRGVAFANYTLVRHALVDHFPGLEIHIPQTVVIGTDVFDQFIEDNDLSEDIQSITDDDEIRQRFLEGQLPEDFVRDLKAAVQKMTGPLAVRSSSLLEDSQQHPFAGIYSTFMLPNSHSDPAVRLWELCRAIKAVYASTYCTNARSYITSTPHTIEEEKMAIIVQRIVGQKYDDRFYPHFSGVALSYNFYPVGGQESNQGIAAIALGLGQTVMSGGRTVQFSPATPGILPQYPTAKDFLRYSQSQFYAVDLARPVIDFSAEEDSSLARCQLSTAEEDGTLNAVGSVYSTQNDTIRDMLTVAGPRVITFNNILRWEAIPLAAALSKLLSVMREGMGRSVEIEFAVDMDDWGRSVTGRRRISPRLYVLQIRPQATHIRGPAVDLDQVSGEEVLCRTNMALGHGVIENIRDVVYVKPEALHRVSTGEVATQIGEINLALEVEERSYLLMGPGRWGSADPELGIPVGWAAISAARVIIETPFVHRTVEPSQGSHFFHNITSLHIGYLTLPSDSHEDPDAEVFFDRDWLEGLPAYCETSAARHVRLEEPLFVCLDGRKSEATILKRLPSELDELDRNPDKYQAPPSSPSPNKG
jgi:CheY-like chemotaxis protein